MSKVRIEIFNENQPADVKHAMKAQFETWVRDFLCSYAVPDYESVQYGARAYLGRHGDLRVRLTRLLRSYNAWGRRDPITRKRLEWYARISGWRKVTVSSEFWTCEGFTL